MRQATIAAAALILAATWRVVRDAELLAEIDTAAAGAVETIESFLPVGWGLSMWSESKIPAQYLSTIRNAEAAQGLPYNMLARLLWEESRYRPDIISGATRSSAGALGIAQFMPATAQEMGINPLDPFAAIPAAARYLKRMYSALGTWDKALAAYNWGIGNVQRKGLAAAPLETRNYYGSILADIGGGAVIA